MYFDRPGLILLVSLATVGPLAGLAVVRWMNEWKQPIGWDAVFSFITLFAIDILNGLVISAWLAQMYDEYTKLDARYDVKPSVMPPVKVYGNMNDNAVYENTTPKVSIDVMTIKIKRFSRTLITQRANGFKVDLREDTWKAHFGGRKNYVEVRDVRMIGAFAKENPDLTNSPFVVVNWGVVEAAASGRMQ